MGLFDRFKKTKGPYNDEAINIIYELLFCDNLDFFKENIEHPDAYPFNILLSKKSGKAVLEKVIEEKNIESRLKILAYFKLRLLGEQINKKDIFAVIVEIGLDDGLDVLAAFGDGTARYINQSGKVIIFESVNDVSIHLTNNIFAKSNTVIKSIGPWDKERRPAPVKGACRMTFLVSDGLYFGEAPINLLFNDPLASPVLQSAAQFMRYLVDLNK